MAERGRSKEWRDFLTVLATERMPFPITFFLAGAEPGGLCVLGGGCSSWICGWGRWSIVGSGGRSWMPGSQESERREEVDSFLRIDCFFVPGEDGFVGW